MKTVDKSSPKVDTVCVVATSRLLMSLLVRDSRVSQSLSKHANYFSVYALIDPTNSIAMQDKTLKRLPGVTLSSYFLRFGMLRATLIYL